jgi:hypothetical protein
VDTRDWHRRGKELVKKLATQGRLVPSPASAAASPADDRAWCAEALATHRARALTGGVIVTERVKSAYQDEKIVARVDQLSATPWWTRRSPSVRLGRTLRDYQAHLEPILRCANSVMFIDPHLDPDRPGYQGFAQLLASAGPRVPAPSIEVHRACWQESSDKRFVPEFKDRIERAFRRALEPVAQATGVKIGVFLWDDFHDRYLISNLIGVLMPNGFDTTTDPNALTTWARMGRDDRDEVQREFDPASGRHKLHHQFVVG